jgi:hypothetical protein
VKFGCRSWGDRVGLPKPTISGTPPPPRFWVMPQAARLQFSFIAHLTCPSSWHNAKMASKPVPKFQKPAWLQKKQAALSQIPKGENATSKPTNQHDAVDIFKRSAETQAIIVAEQEQKERRKKEKKERLAKEEQERNERIEKAKQRASRASVEAWVCNHLQSSVWKSLTILHRVRMLNDKAESPIRNDDE